YIPYCSSDCWSGTNEGNYSSWNHKMVPLIQDNFWPMLKFSQNGDANNSGFKNLHFMGSVIVNEVIQQLVHLGLANGHSLVLSGSSAGGVGVLLNLDHIRRQVTKMNLEVDVKGVADSAWFLDNKPFAPLECQDAHSCSPNQAMKLGHNLWKSRLPRSCEILNQNKPWECFLGYKILPTIQSSLFIFQWVFDEAQMQMDNVGKPVSKQQWNYIHSNGERIKRSLNNLSAVFAPSCISHTSLTSRHWSSVKVNGVSLSDALNCWSKLKGENNSTLLERQKAELSNGIHNMLILSSNRKNNNNSSTELSRIVKRPKKTRRRINKTRHSRNKQNRGRKSKRRKKGGRNATNLDYFETSENVMTSLNSTIGNMLSDSPGLTDPKATKPFESVPVSLQESASSSNLLKQRKRERRRKRRKQKKKERKRKRKHRKKEKRKKNRREERRNKKKKIDSVAESTDNVSTLMETDSRSRRSSVDAEGYDGTRAGDEIRTMQYSKSGSETHGKKEPSCQTHLIDQCSWPHCNPTCPPLMNPYTGTPFILTAREEMSRIQLLKSFGLSMTDLAVALGIDIETLKSMDNKEIFLILSP
ncbi:Palmitoleoyl-protein carboxylesterase NOTUM, partial [Armadillidium nasatum]